MPHLAGLVCNGILHGHLGWALLRRKKLATVLLDMLAAFTLAVRSRAGWPRILKAVAALLLMPTVALHGLAWWVTGIFAG